MRQIHRKAITYMLEQSLKEANVVQREHRYLKSITDQAFSGLGTEKPQPFKGERSSSQDPERYSFLRPWLQPLLALASTHLVLDKEQVISPNIRVPETVPALETDGKQQLGKEPRWLLGV